MSGKGGFTEDCSCRPIGGLNAETITQYVIVGTRLNGWSLVPVSMSNRSLAITVIVHLSCFLHLSPERLQLVHLGRPPHNIDRADADVLAVLHQLPTQHL